MTKKLCPKCGIVKLSDSFGKRRGTKDGLDWNCKDCKKKYRTDNKDTVKNYYIKHTFGITREEYDSIISRGCEVCGTKVDLCVDHDHRTGKVRGCLCQSCNKALGNVKDNPTILRKLAFYLEVNKVE